MKKHNKLSKIISTIITVCMLLSICSVSVAFADGDRIYADATYEYYVTKDTSSNTTNVYGIYMESKYANLVYHTSAFVNAGYDNGNYSAISWPPELDTRTPGDGYPAQNATITKDGSDYIVRSNSSKVKYRMPARITPSDAQVSSGLSFNLEEAMIIDYAGSYSGGKTRGMNGVVAIGEKYEKMHFLIGHTGELAGDGRVGEFQVHAVYEDGTTTLPEGVTTTFVDWASKNIYKYPSEMKNIPDSDGRNGYICETLPLTTAAGQKGADNFVADFVTFHSPSGVGSNKKTTYQGQFSSANQTKSLVAYEYTLTLDPTKVIKELVFSQSSGRGGYMVLGISGENEREDWTDKVAEINAAIADLGVDSQASDISNTMAMINSAVEAGVESYVDTETFNGLFSNGQFTKNLVDAMLAEVDVEDVTWDDTTNKFKDLDDVASVIEETGNLETCPAKEDILNAYTGMVDSLINEEGKDNDEMIERFELLKSVQTPAFQTIFDDKIIYNTTTPSINTTPEFVTFEVDFSKPVDSAKFVKDNFEVLRGEEKVDSSWITVEQKLTGSDITGAIVKVLNSQDYSKAYTLNVSKDLKGENGESWGYQLTKLDNAAAPFEVSTSGVELKADGTFKGKISLKNSTDSANPCKIMIASYDENGKYLGTIYALIAEGNAKKGTSNIEFSGLLPEGAEEVICYVYDSVTSMTLLTPPITIEIPAE